MRSRRTVPPTFWSMRRLTSDARVAWLWIADKASDTGVVWPWDAARCAEEAFDGDETPLSVDGLVAVLDSAGQLLRFDWDGRRGVAVARWDSACSDDATLPGKDDPYPSMDEVRRWEREVGLPFLMDPSRARTPSDRPSDIEASQATLVFSHWAAVRAARRAGVQPATMDEVRLRFIVGALRAGITVERAKMAIEGCFASPWHMGENPDRRVHDGLEMIFKDQERIDRFCEIARIVRGGLDEDYESSAERQMRDRKRRLAERQRSKRPPSLDDFDDDAEVSA